MKYAKFWAAALGAVCTSAVAVFGADTTVGKLATILFAGCTAVAVYAIPNDAGPSK